MRGTFSSVEQTIILIAAISLCLMLLSLVFNLWPTETSAASGSRTEVSKFLAGKVQECFREHNYGLDPISGVCGEFVIESNGTVTEADITKYLDCSKMPNSDCPGCGKCTGSEGSGGNRLHVDITKERTYVSVEYLASERRVEVIQFGCFSDADCGDGDNCTTDTCMFPGTKESACTHKYSCTTGGGGENASCTRDSDCVPAQCCHPTSCVPETAAPDCQAIMCTQECAQGAMDCGAGRCGCSEGKCIVVWATA